MYCRRLVLITPLRHETVDTCIQHEDLVFIYLFSWFIIHGHVLKIDTADGANTEAVGVSDGLAIWQLLRELDRWWRK